MSSSSSPTMAVRHRAVPDTEAGMEMSPPFDSSDPLHLRRSIKPADELARIRSNTKRKRDTINPLVLAGRRDPSRLAAFYHSQNEQIERFLKPVHAHVADARESNESSALQYKIAVYASFAANIILAILQLYGAISSGSLSLFTTMADSIFDPMSNVTLILCNRAVAKVDPRKYPAGKARIETAGNIAFCFLMTAVSFILIAFSCQELVRGSKEATSTFHLPSVIAVAIAFCTKLSLFLYCYALRNKYSQVQILWQDHRNDLFINGFGILTSVGGSKLRWWIDPMGAIILSVLISVLWLRTATSEFNLLIGKSADAQTLQHLTYIAMNHSPEILQVDTVRAWYSGPRLNVEIDIVLDPECSLRDSHDVAESLQMEIESLPEVERANVHNDYEVTHKPEHFLKKEL